MFEAWHRGRERVGRARGIRRCWSFQAPSISRKPTPVVAFGQVQGSVILCLGVKPLTQPFRLAADNEPRRYTAKLMFRKSL